MFVKKIFERIDYMSLTSVTNTQIKELVEKAYAQAFKAETISSSGIDFTVFNTGSTEDITSTRDKFTKALISEVARTYYVDRFKTDVPSSKWYVDSEKYGAIEQWLTVSLPSAKDNTAMQDFTNGQTVGTVTIAMPTITNHVYQNTVSWALPLTITGQQWDTAFKSESSLNSFVMFVLSQFEGNAQFHDYELGLQNRNAMLSKKIEQSTSSGVARGIYNLIAEYCKEYWVNDGTYNFSNLRTNGNFLRYAIEKIGILSNRFTKFNNLFITDSTAEPYLVPKTDVICEINEDVWTRITSTIADTYRNNWTLPDNLEMVGKWQSFTSPMSIKHKDGTANEKTHNDIMGFIADKYACIHTHVSQRTASKYLEMENLTHYEKQYVDRYMINLDRKICILSLASVTVATTSGTKTFKYTINGIEYNA